jgi:hypothetical protein
MYADMMSKLPLVTLEYRAHGVELVYQLFMFVMSLTFAPKYLCPQTSKTKPFFT